MWRTQFVKACIGMCWNSMQYCKFRTLDCWAVMSTKMVHCPVWNLRHMMPWILMCTNNSCGRVSKFPRHYIEWLFFFVVEYVKNIGLWAVTRFMMLTENRGLSCSVSENMVFCTEEMYDCWKNNYVVSCGIIEGNQSRNQTQPRSIWSCPSHFMTDCRWMIQSVSHCSFWSPV